MGIRVLTAIAVLGCSALALAEDNLPPVPKKRIVVASPTPTTTEIEATAIVVKKDSPLPSVSGKVEAMPSACGEAGDAPLPPIPEGQPVKNCSTYKPRCCCCCKPIQPVKFLANELLRKPIYAVEKAFNDAEGRRICRESCRLKRESERLACQAKKLEEKVKDTCPHDLHAKLKPLKEEVELAESANNNTVRRAKLECRQAEYCRQKNRLEAKRTELFPACD